MQSWSKLGKVQKGNFPVNESVNHLVVNQSIAAFCWSLVMVALEVDHITPLQLIKMVGIPLHHGSALFYVDCLVVDAGDSILGMG